MVRISWTSQAKADLKGIADYIAVDSKHYAKLQVQNLRNRTNILKKYPNAGRVVPEFEDKTIRELIAGNYRLIYKVQKKNSIQIVAIHHCARDLTKRKLHT